MPSQNVIAYAKLHNLSTDWNEWSPGEFQDFFNWKNDTGMDNMVEMTNFGAPSESTSMASGYTIEGGSAWGSTASSSVTSGNTVVFPEGGYGWGGWSETSQSDPTVRYAMDDGTLQTADELRSTIADPSASPESIEMATMQLQQAGESVYPDSIISDSTNYSETTQIIDDAGDGDVFERTANSSWRSQVESEYIDEQIQRAQRVDDLTRIPEEVEMTEFPASGNRITPYGTPGQAGEAAEIEQELWEWDDSKAAEPGERWMGQEAPKDVAELPAEYLTGLEGSEAEAVAGALAKSFEPPNIMGEMVISTKTIMKNIKALGKMAALTPLMMWLHDQGDFCKIAVDSINNWGTISAFLTQDPLTMAAAVGIPLVMDFIKQQNNIRDNNYQDARDSRYLMVKDGGKWYPAILKNRTKNESFFGGDDSIIVEYGDPSGLYFTTVDGKPTPHFRNSKAKQFRMAEDEWSDPEKNTLEYIQKHDFYRQFRFLSADEEDAINNTYLNKLKRLSGEEVEETGDETVWSIVDEDTSGYTDWMKEMSDVQKVLDIVQTDDNMDKQHIDNLDHLYSATKGMRERMQYQWGIEEAHEVGFGGVKEHDFTNSNLFPRQGEEYGINTKFDSYNAGLLAVKELNSGVIPRRVKVLEAARRQAAQSIHVDPGGYIDTRHDFPLAGTYDELQQQWDKIASFTDRNDFQKEYLKQKVTTRYLMNVSDKQGHGADLVDRMHDQTISGVPDRWDMFYRDGAIPPWVNKGEGEVPDSFHIWHGWQTGQRDESKKNFKQFQDHWENKLGETYDVLIENAAVDLQHNVDPAVKYRWDPDDPVQRARALQYWNTSVAKPIDKGTDLDPMLYKPMKHTKGGLKGWYRAFFGNLDRLDRKQKQTPHSWHEDSYVRHGFTGEVTYEKYLQAVQNPDFKPTDIGETSFEQIMRKFTKGEFDWVPEGQEINKRNFPEWMIKGREDSFRKLVDEIDRSGDTHLRQRSAYLKDMFEKPSVANYMKRYHPDGVTSGISKDDFGNFELTDDWEIASRGPDINQVRVGHTIHRRMDFHETPEVDPTPKAAESVTQTAETK